VLSDAELYQLIFQPGFSTAKEVSALSGRGVGLDVVKRTIEGMRGSIDSPPNLARARRSRYACR
jgi:two-component system chemotaxis sensor kinase CheA